VVVADDPASIGTEIRETTAGTRSSVSDEIDFVNGETSHFVFGQAGKWFSFEMGRSGVDSSESWQLEQQSCESATSTAAVFAQRSKPASQRQTPVGSSSGRHATSVSNLAENAVNNGSRLRICL